MWYIVALVSQCNIIYSIDVYKRQVRGQLSVGALKQENVELHKSNGLYKYIIEQHGLGHLLGKRKERSHREDAR